MIEATVFQDSELHRLLTLLPQIRESLPKNIVGLTFFVELPGGFAGAQVFVDRVCEAVWHVKRNNWRYDNTSSVHVKFKQGVKSSDVLRFLLVYEYSVLHELLHSLHDEILCGEVIVHSAAKSLLMANQS